MKSVNDFSSYSHNYLFIWIYYSFLGFFICKSKVVSMTGNAKIETFNEHHKFPLIWYPNLYNWLFWQICQCNFLLFPVQLMLFQHIFIAIKFHEFLKFWNDSVNYYREKFWLFEKVKLFHFIFFFFINLKLMFLFFYFLNWKTDIIVFLTFILRYFYKYAKKRSFWKWLDFHILLCIWYLYALSCMLMLNLFTTFCLY